MPLESQKIEVITCTTDCCVFARFGAVPPGPITTVLLDVSILLFTGASMFHQMVTNWRKISLGFSLKFQEKREIRNSN